MDIYTRFSERRGWNISKLVSHPLPLGSLLHPCPFCEYSQHSHTILVYDDIRLGHNDAYAPARPRSLFTSSGGERLEVVDVEEGREGDDNPEGDAEQE